MNDAQGQLSLPEWGWHYRDHQEPREKYVMAQEDLTRVDKAQTMLRDTIKYSVDAAMDFAKTFSEKAEDTTTRFTKRELRAIAEDILRNIEYTKDELRDVQQILDTVGRSTFNKSIIAEAEEEANRIRKSAAKWHEWDYEQKRKKLRESMANELDILSKAMEEDVNRKIEEEVRRRINQMFGKESTLKRKRALAI